VNYPERVAEKRRQLRHWCTIKAKSVMMPKSNALMVKTCIRDLLEMTDKGR